MNDVFEALVAPARRAILDELLDRDNQTLFELCARLAMKHQLGLTRQGISQHLDVLESAGLIATARQGRYKFHYLRTKPLQQIVERWLRKPEGAEKRNEDRSDQRIRRRLGKSPSVLHRKAGVHKEDRSPPGRAPLAHSRGPR